MEYQDFLQRMIAIASYDKDIKELNKFVSNIGELGNGAEERYFKKEGFADRIRQPTPESFDQYKPDPKDYGLRLFCMRLSENVVILFNGGRKTYKKAEKCPNCGKYFEEANRIAEAITVAFYFRKIEINGNVIDFLDDDFELAI